MPKAFITGGAGFVGSHVVKQLVDHGYDVTVYNSYVVYIPAKPGEEQLNYAVRLAEVFDRIRLIRGDTLSEGFLRRQLNAVKPDVIIHTDMSAVQ